MNKRSFRPMTVACLAMVLTTGKLFAYTADDPGNAGGADTGGASSASTSSAVTTLSYSVGSGQAAWDPYFGRTDRGSTTVSLSIQGDIAANGSQSFFYRPGTAGGVVTGSYSRTSHGDGNHEGYANYSKDTWISLPWGGGLLIPTEVQGWFSGGGPGSGLFNPPADAQYVFLWAKVSGNDWLFGSRTSSDSKKITYIADSSLPTVSIPDTEHDWQGVSLNVGYSASDAGSGLASRKLYYSDGHHRNESGHLLWSDFSGLNGANINDSRVVVIRSGYYKIVATDRVGNSSQRIIADNGRYRFPDDYLSGQESIAGLIKIKDVTAPVLSLEYKGETGDYLPYVSGSLPVLTKATFRIKASEIYFQTDSFFDTGTGLTSTFTSNYPLGNYRYVPQYGTTEQGLINEWISAETTSLVESDTYHLTFKATDLAGNSTEASADVRVLKARPVIIISPTGQEWYSTGTITVTATDSVGRTHLTNPALLLFSYSTDKKPVGDISKIWTPITSSTITLGQGANTVDFRAIDETGIPEYLRKEIGVDTQDPTLFRPEGIPEASWNSGKVFTNAVSLSGSVSDGTSLLDALSVARTDTNNESTSISVNLVPTPGDETTKTYEFTPEEGAFTYTFTLTDVAGNKTTKTVQIVKDTTGIEVGQLVYSYTNLNTSSTEVMGTDPGKFSNLTLRINGQANNYAKPVSITWTLDGVAQGSGPVPTKKLGDTWYQSVLHDLSGLSEGRHEWTATVTDEAGNSTTSLTFAFTLDRTAPALVKGWVKPEAGADSTTFTVASPTTETGSPAPETNIVIYQVVGQVETKLWDSGEVKDNGIVRKGSFAVSPTTGIGTITLRAVDRAGNSTGHTSFTLVRPAQPSEPTLSKIVAATKESFSLSVKSSDPATSWNGLGYTLVYRGVGTDAAGTALAEATVVSATSKAWSYGELTTAKAVSAGSLGYFKVWAELTPPATDASTIALDQTGKPLTYTILNSPPAFTVLGTWAAYLGTSVSPFTTSTPVAKDPDGHKVYYRYQVVSGGKTWTSAEEEGKLPQFVPTSMKTGDPTDLTILTETWLKTNGATITLQAWAGPATATAWAADVATLAPAKSYLPADMDFLSPSVSSVGTPWASTAVWTSATSFSVTLGDQGGSGLASASAKALPLDGDEKLDPTRAEVVLPLSSFPSGTGSVTLTGTIPKVPTILTNLVGLYQLSVTVTDRAGNTTTLPTLRAQFDFVAPTVTKVAQANADSLGVAKATLTGADTGGSGLEAWEYQLTDSGKPWVYGGPWAGSGPLAVTVLPEWTGKTQKMRWRVKDQAGNRSPQTEADWATVTYDPAEPAFSLNVTGMVAGAGGLRYVNSLDTLSVTATGASPAPQWRSVRIEADGSEAASDWKGSLSEVKALVPWWADGSRYRIEAKVTNANQISGIRDTGLFLLDRSAPTAVSLTLVGPNDQNRSDYYRNESFKVNWSGGTDEHSGVVRQLQLYQQVGSVRTTLNTLELGEDQAQATMSWGTSAINWSQGSFRVEGTATNGAGAVVTSASVAVAVSITGPWLTVAIPAYNAGTGSLAASWSSGNVEFDHYEYQLWKRSGTDTPVSEWQPSDGNSALIDLSGVTLADQDQLFVAVRAVDAQRTPLVTGTSVTSLVDVQVPTVAWRARSLAVTSARVGGWFDADGSASGISKVQWKIEKKAAGESDWSEVAPGWRSLAPGSSAGPEADLSSVLETNDLVRLTVRVENGVGRVAQDTTGALVVDDTAPPAPVVLDQGEAVNYTKQSLTFNWRLSEQDPETGLKSYEYGWFYRGEATAPTLWTTVSSQDLAASVDLKSQGAAVDGKVVVLAVRATNQAGLSQIGYSDGIILDQTAPLVYSVAVYADSAKSQVLRGYIKADAVTANKVYLKVGAIDGQSSWSNGNVQARRWNAVTNVWDAIGAAVAISGTEAELTVSGGLASGSLWRFESRVTDVAGNLSALGVSDGFLVEGAVPSVTGLQLEVDATNINLSWSLSDPQGARWIQSYGVTAVWTDAQGMAHTEPYTVSQRAASLVWGPGGLNLATGTSVRFTVTGYSYTGAHENSSEGTDDYQASLTIDTRPPNLLAETRAPSSPASQFYDRITAHLAYSGDRGVSSLQWSAVLVPGEVPLVDWQEKNWATAWDLERVFSAINSDALNNWQGKQIRLRFRAANSMGIWSDLSSSSAVKIDTKAPEATLVRASAFSKELGSVTGWTIGLKDLESGILSYMTALVPVAAAGTYSWPETAVNHPVANTSSTAVTTEAISIPLADGGVGSYIPLMRVRNGTGHWFVISGPALEIDRTAPQITSLVWTGTSPQSWQEQGKSVAVSISNGPTQELKLGANEPSSWTVSGDWFDQQQLSLSTSQTTSLSWGSREAGSLYPVTIVAEDRAGNQTTVQEILRYNRAPQVTLLEEALTVRPGNPVRLDSFVAINDDEGLRAGDYPLTLTWVPGNGSAVQLWSGGSTLASVFGPSSALHTASFLQSGLSQVTSYQGTLVVTDRYGKATASIPLPMRVENSHEGQLMVDETWTDAGGSFELRGWVTVPAGRTLTLDQAEVTVEANLDAQGIMEAGILVQPGGKLKVVNTGPTHRSVVQSAMGGVFWKGIRAQGELSGAGLEVSGAERALSLDGGTINLAESWLKGNLIGLHLLGGTLVWRDGTVESNQEYGVKEDGSGSFSVKNTVLRDNGVNYYRHGVTVLTLDQINQEVQ